MNGSCLRLAHSDGSVSHLRKWDHARASRDQMPACLLIHGFGESSCSWADYGAALDCFETVYAVDLRGHGDSSWDSAARYDVEGFADDVVHVLERLGLAELAIVGHSLGGDVALQVASMRPERVRAVVMVDFGPELSQAGLAKICTDLRANLRVFDSREAFLDALIEARPLVAKEVAARMARDSLRELGEARFTLKLDCALATFEPPDLQSPARCAIVWDKLRALSCPVLVLRGAMSGMLSRDSAERAARGTANGTMREVRGAGHAVMLDNPGGFLAATREFFGTLR
ncbi:alpha/beta fold hydrolase [Burkholderia gladioli]|uniref:Alpha/beta hydrolase family protein n=2 Tax=Burkholderia gladioli TaxID=28095 RepID=F2LRJ2_BURGS|nr:alpha/beta hydrolase [Burkholderia gladioli]AEA65486.1 alpha/beta hydrolase family protein [Burkholderia gladioli BSR3]MBW5286418.1 alpha/beta hydrolase [Burkholderia gladioli]